MKISQIMPADGWGAALVHCNFDRGMRLYDEPLVGWALGQDSDGDTAIEGVIVCPGHSYTITCQRAGYETSEEDEGPTYFCGYLRPGQEVEDYHEEAERLYEHWYTREAGDRQLLEAGWRISNDGRFTRYVSPNGREMKRHEAIKELRQGEGEG